MAKDFFTEEQKVAIVNSIKTAENKTSGEVQVHIENYCNGEVLDRAAEVFSALNMQNTKLRNGVLFYLAVEDHKFAILGDEGINNVVPDDFWEKIIDMMTGYFIKGLLAEGLCAGIEASGKQLKEHFPVQEDDINELPDDISFGH
ncbi:TPM domain-containing protein [Cytophagaceae bacterium ABcell3]|nr:TPM domain-containing protein [Cytophagaceae bacterium ABcell3]